ncbi:cadmium-translocating P-type ATPase [Sporosarcina sp. E16_3]|uniref:heavy metal translocating P-type ATPase n=1 Tax=Sporosarcina sp. E16_3 TaxID=2789293 RepID=UPI001A939A24|nr:heavy metal translocating P-type ATPase [Sporosarcina sp. E16_3]MBO0603708.1 cadmium-translocating P-type ATPase [Sporosarcina sp. E16_3]
MDEKCCSTKAASQKIVEQTTCCSSNQATQIETKQGDMTNCCSSNTIDKVVEDECCNKNSMIMEENTKVEACCGGKELDKISIVSVDCCTNTKEILHPMKLNKGLKEEFRVYGMDCPACAVTIEKSLISQKNINEVNVNYSTGKMQVSSTDELEFEFIQKQIKKLGFEVEPIKVNNNLKTYFIEGMDCGSCALTIENHLNNISTVKHVQVNFSTGKMKIEHENSPEEIMNEVAKAGFKASLITNNKLTPSSTRSSNQNGTVIFSGILIALGFIGSYTGISPYLTITMYAVAMIISGYKPVKSAYYAIRSRSLDMNVLMSAAAIGAAFLGEWLEGATVVWLFSLGLNLQNRAIEKTRKSIRGLMELTPPEAWVKIGNELIKKPVEDVLINDVIVVKPGDRIPLDGDVIEGESSVNQAAITGESIPVDKVKGSFVYAGSINEHGSLSVKVTKLIEDTTISKIIHLVEEAQEKKAPTEAFIDKFARVYTPVVFILALLVIIIPPLLAFGTWEEWIYKGLMLLVIACPCALVISTPVAIVTALGNAAKNGVLIKGGTFLENAGSINAIAFDKTGTLTEGKPKVTDVLVFNDSEENMLSIARTLEEYSTHPIAKTIVNYAKAKSIHAKSGAQFKNRAGKGIQAKIGNVPYFAGNLKLFEEVGTPITNHLEQILSLQNEGKTIVIIGTVENILGIICVSDTIRKTTKVAIANLEKIGVKQIIMLTGDNEGTAKAIAFEAGVNRYFSELLPEEKVDAIKQLQEEGYRVAMVGDGINDAPALATANLGIAMGGAGTDTAMETADIVLMADNLDKLPHTIKLSRKAISIIKQNIWFSIIVKIVALLLIFPGWLTLWVAVLSDAGAALIVILNSLRLLKVKG